MKNAILIILAVAVLYLAYLKFVKEPKDKQAATGGDVKPNTPSNNSVAPTVASNDSFPLKKGSVGANVKLLQIRLGFTGASLDGKFGENTENELIKRTGKATVDSLLEMNTKLASPPKVASNVATANRFIIGKDYTVKSGVNVVPYFRNSDKTFSKHSFSNFRLDALDSVMYMGTQVNNKPTFYYNSFIHGAVYFNLNDTDLM